MSKIFLLTIESTIQVKLHVKDSPHVVLPTLYRNIKERLIWNEWKV